MFATRVLRQAAAHAERTPSIKFLGRRSIPCTSALTEVLTNVRSHDTNKTSPASIDHSPAPHPASPTGKLPANFGNGSASPKHTSFSSYRDHAQQHGPLQRTIGSGVGGSTGHQLGSVVPPSGVAFDRSELPARFRRQPLDMAEIEAVESGGAALFG
ncbi:hypothetical protein CPAR01_13301 [Colletotrichum paranaense]|uniref:Ribosomal protein YMR-31 n=1 Tax=Colletotrichum paranaense TaxID=1914294 RepID=A0ABQ9S5M7_9PEZI|nr:uncharacterized protein CPAR01_13301 [Colletotrichum paranaense]KAK1526773.1 hypothetical protein CPAR01_13301 [Colletotrichum paranaense]